VDEKRFRDAVVDKIPRQDLVGFLLSINVGIGTDIRLAKCTDPIAAQTVSRQQNLSDLSVSQCQQRLDVVPFRQFVNDSNRPLAAQTLSDPPDSLPDDGDVFQRVPLEGGCGLRNKLIDAERQTPEAIPSPREFPRSTLHLPDQPDDRLDILVRFRRQADHEVESCLHDTTFHEFFNCGEDLLFTDPLPDDISKPLGTRFGGQGNGFHSRFLENRRHLGVEPFHAEGTDGHVSPPVKDGAAE